MAKQVKLAAEPRTAIGRSAVRKLKAAGSVPAGMYGSKDKTQTLQGFKSDINAPLSPPARGNIFGGLEIAGKSRLALVQEVQHAPLGGAVLHIDFHAVSQDEVIQADVPLEPVGTANGVKNMGGLLEQSLRSLAIECLPRDLPDVIRVDVSALDIGDSIHVREIELPAGVTTRIQQELTAFSVLAPTVEEEPVAATAEAAAGPEVITAKKEEPEAGAAPGGAAPKEKEAKK